MDAPQALADLIEISSQLVDVAIIDADGAILATTADPPARAEHFVGGIQRLVEQAEALREARELPDLAQLEAATLDGSVFVVLRDGRTIAATTRPDPTVGLVFYDLKHCLRSIEDGASSAPSAEGDAAEGTEPPTVPEPAAEPEPSAEPEGPAQPESSAEPATPAKPTARRKKSDAAA